MSSPAKRSVSALMFVICGAIVCFVIGMITLVIGGPSMALFFGVGGILTCIALGMLTYQLRRRPGDEVQPLDDRKYLWMMVFLILIGLPLLSQLLIFVLNDGTYDPVWLCTLVGALIAAGFGFLLGLKVHLPDRFSMRYLPLLLAILYVLVVWDVAMFLSRGSFAGDMFSGIVVLAFIPYLLINLVVAISGTSWWMTLLVPLVTYCVFFGGLVAGAWCSGRGRTTGRGMVTCVVAIIAAAIVCGGQAVAYIH